jgi:D-alanine-D-alanine ligase
MVRTIVGVLRGGTSSEYPLSLKTGAAMLNALPEDRYDVRDILIDKKGMWHLRGTPATPARALSQVDVVLSALHGGVGEDGSVHRIIERTGIPYAGTRPLQSALALNKTLAKSVLTNAGLRMPAGMTFTLRDRMNTAEMAHALHAVVAPPYIVKPQSEGASTGVRYVPSLVELPDALGDVLDAHGAVVAEEFIRGDEASVGVINGFRNEDVYVLPPAHVRKDGMHLERHHHESGLLEHTTPGGFTYVQKQSLMDIAKMAHKILALSHFSRSDLIVSPRGVYLLEVNTTPGLYPGATFPSMLRAVGSSLTEFLEHSIELARSHA